MEFFNLNFMIQWLLPCLQTIDHSLQESCFNVCNILNTNVKRNIFSEGPEGNINYMSANLFGYVNKSVDILDNTAIVYPAYQLCACMLFYRS